MYSVYNEKITSLNHFAFHLPQIGARADPKKIGSSSNFKSAPAPAIKPRLRPAPQHWFQVRNNLESGSKIFIYFYRHLDSSVAEPLIFRRHRIRPQSLRPNFVGSGSRQKRASPGRSSSGSRH